MEEKKSRRELEAKISAKAIKNKEFKAKLMVDPKSAIEEALEIKLKDGAKVKVFEPENDEWNIELKKAPRNESSLTEEQLGQMFEKAERNGRAVPPGMKCCDYL